MFQDQCATIIERYRTAGLTIATAESCTGGMLSGALTQIAGSSDVFDRGFVTYSYPSKTKLLGVPSDMLAEHGAVSATVAQAMATGALSQAQTSVAISITGVAGPGASEHKPEGLVYFGLASNTAAPITVKKEFGALGRDQVRQASVAQALDMLLGSIKNPAQTINI